MLWVLTALVAVMLLNDQLSFMFRRGITLKRKREAELLPEDRIRFPSYFRKYRNENI